ncbi:hypothetical protein [Burkholderia sp. LMU1-1-1.1]|uniref:hypothetical protein n=1 Tax=Burkholderia sp. LMU1-1-1.1 TaxID=3135266 RepID=UPI00343C7FC2
MINKSSVIALPAANRYSKLISAVAPVSSVSVFSDLLWDRSEYVDRTKAKGAVVRWEYLFERFGSTHSHIVVSLMEFAYAMIFDPVEQDLQMDTKSVSNYVSLLGRFLEFMQVSHLYEMSELGHDHVRDYVIWLVKKREERRKNEDTQQASLEWVEQHIRGLRWYFRYAKRVSQPLLIDPLHGQSIYKHLGKPSPIRGDNRTPVIPVNIWNRYLCASLDYVEHYAPDIIDAHLLLENLRADILPLYIDRPTFNACNFSRDHTDPALMGMRQKFALNPATGMPWRKCWSGIQETLDELRALYTACLVVVGSLSGMRETEIALIQIGGFWEYSSNDGPGKRYRIASRLTKGKQDTNQEWEVNEPVFKACKILEKLTSFARAYSTSKELFLQGWDRGPSSYFKMEVGKSKLIGKNHGHLAVIPVGAGAFTRYLRRFASHLDEAFDGQYKLPHVDGKPWNFIMRMLRRSLAGRIAREPFGMIAGMLHYKHVRITTFAGYAGSDPEWIKELHDEEIAANEEFLDDICEGLIEGALAGGKGEDLLREFSGVAGDLKKNAHQYFLENNRANLHVGLFNYCMFNAERALCLNEKEQGNLQPMLSACHPDRCANSCITTKHRPLWEVQATDARAMLDHPRISTPQRIALSRDLDVVKRVLKKLQGAA